MWSHYFAACFVIAIINLFLNAEKRKFKVCRIELFMRHSFREKKLLMFIESTQSFNLLFCDCKIEFHFEITLFICSTVNVLNSILSEIKQVYIYQTVQNGVKLTQKHIIEFSALFP